jgi:hypothetical protein
MPFENDWDLLRFIIFNLGSDTDLVPGRWHVTVNPVGNEI